MPNRNNDAWRNSIVKSNNDIGMPFGIQKFTMYQLGGIALFMASRKYCWRITRLTSSVHLASVARILLLLLALQHVFYSHKRIVAGLSAYNNIGRHVYFLQGARKRGSFLSQLVSSYHGIHGK